MVTSKARNEEARAVSRKVTSPKELTAIQDEVASLKRRQGTLEDELLELMEQRETLEAELAELAGRRDSFSAEQAEVTKARDAALVEIDRELDGERSARDGLVPKGRAAARPLRPDPRPPGRGRHGRAGRQHLPGLPGIDLAGRAGRHPQAPTRGDQALRELPPDPGGRVTPTDVVVWTDGGARGTRGRPATGRW